MTIVNAFNMMFIRQTADYYHWNTVPVWGIFVSSTASYADGELTVLPPKNDTKPNDGLQKIQVK